MSGELERSLSFAGCVGVIVGMVIGASIFVIIPTLAGMTGPSLYLAYVISAVPAIFTALYLMQLAGALPVTGSNYVAVTRWISPMAGFTISIAAVVAMISTNCIVAWGIAEYIASYFPNVSKIGIAISVVLAFGIINYLGVKIFEWVQILMVALLILAMLIFGIAGLFHINPAYNAPLFPKGLGSFFMVVAVATFSWAGFIAITEVAGEVKDPKRNIPLSIIFSLLIIMVIYVLQTYVFTGTLLWSKSAKIGPTAVLVAARNFLPRWAVSYIATAAILAMATTINAIVLMGAREMLAWSRDQVIPASLNRTHKRFKTPYLTVGLITILSICGVIFAASLEKYALMVIFALMVIQGLGSTAVWLMPKRAPEIYSKALFRFSTFWSWFTWLGCVVTFSLIFLFGMLADLKTGIIFLFIMLGGVIYWYLRKSYLYKQGFSIEDRMKEFTDATLGELGL